MRIGGAAGMAVGDERGKRSRRRTGPIPDEVFDELAKSLLDHFACAGAGR
jgi:hypothetical protein